MTSTDRFISLLETISVLDDSKIVEAVKNFYYQNIHDKFNDVIYLTENKGTTNGNVDRHLHIHGSSKYIDLGFLKREPKYPNFKYNVSNIRDKFKIIYLIDQ